jgi:hypothetical protein
MAPKATNNTSRPALIFFMAAPAVCLTRVNCEEREGLPETMPTA